MLSALAKKLLSHLRQTSMIPPNSTCLIAISGGGDSVALISLFRELSTVLNLSLCAAHLDHSLRPESSADADFVANLCSKLNVPLLSERIDVASYAISNRLSLEEAGRNLRYNLFKRAMQHFKASHLLTAHTASDQAETLLMRLISGTDLQGLGGIPPQRQFAEYSLVRPLLIFTGTQLREYLVQQGILWREDSTNHIPDAPRTRVRLQLLPILEEWNPRIIYSLNALAERARQDESCLLEYSRHLLSKVEHLQGAIWIYLEELAKFPAAIRRRFYRELLSSPTRQLGAIHLSALDDLVVQGINGAHLDLPDSLIADIFQDKLRLGTKSLKIINPIPQKFSLASSFGIQVIPDWNLEIEINNAEISRRPNSECIYLDPQKISAPLYIRSRNPGDAFYPAGGRGRTKLKKYLNELSIPPEKRDLCPLLCCGDDIVWVIGYRADQRYLAKPNQANVWQLKVKTNKTSIWRD